MWILKLFLKLDRCPDYASLCISGLPASTVSPTNSIAEDNYKTISNNAIPVIVTHKNAVEWKVNRTINTAVYYQ